MFDLICLYLTLCFFVDDETVYCGALFQSSSLWNCLRSQLNMSINPETLCSEFILLYEAFQKKPTANSTSTSFLIPVKHCVWGHFLWLVGSQVTKLCFWSSPVSWMFGCDRIEKSDVLPLNTLLSFCSPPNTHTKQHLSSVLCRALRPTVFTSVNFWYEGSWQRQKFTVHGKILLKSPTDWLGPCPL